MVNQTANTLLNKNNFEELLEQAWSTALIALESVPNVGHMSLGSMRKLVVIGLHMNCAIGAMGKFLDGAKGLPDDTDVLITKGFLRP